MAFRHLRECFGCSHDNPASLQVVRTVVPDGAEGRVRFGAQHQGACRARVPSATDDRFVGRATISRADDEAVALVEAEATFAIVGDDPGRGASDLS